MKVRVIGLDLSVMATGVASNLGWVTTIPSSSLPTDASVDAVIARLVRVKRLVLDQVGVADLVVVEGLMSGRFASGVTMHHDVIGLWYLVMEAISQRAAPVAVVRPGTLKVYATGNGGSSKEKVYAATVRRYPTVDFQDNNQTDAYTLAAMGADYLGQPVTDLPDTHRRALKAVKWPYIPARPDLNEQTEAA